MSSKVPLNKIRRASRVLLFKSHTKPGIKGWELRSQLGEKYIDIVLATDKIFREYLGLRIVAVNADGRKIEIKNENKNSLRKATFLVLVDQPLTIRDLKTAGWRIDEIASLSLILLYLLSHNGVANINDLRNLLVSKISKARVNYILSKLLRLGYIEEKDDKIIIGWRSKIEIDFEKLLGVV